MFAIVFLRKKLLQSRIRYHFFFICFSFFLYLDFSKQLYAGEKKNEKKSEIKGGYRSFLKKKWIENKACYQSIHQKIQPFAIYFPQFHEVPENNINFYEHYTDMMNLKDLIALRKEGKIENTNHILTPLKGWVDYYDLIQDKDKIDDQILTAKAYGIAGFAIYHYWFCKNDFFPQKNKVMPDVVDKIFSRQYTNFNFFFIWPTGDWCPALTNQEIDNPFFVEKHFYDLLPYFKHKNYYKINNRPVFIVLGRLNQETIQLLNQLSIESGFSGIYIGFHLNLTDNPSSLSKGCTPNAYSIIAPSWKESHLFGFAYPEGNRYIIDYEKYLGNIEEKTIQHISPDVDVIFNLFPNFDNTVRNLHGRKQILSGLQINNYSCVNATLSNFDLYMKKILGLYDKRKNNGKLFIINAWNEWGENMSIEPSNELEFNYLECIQENLKTYFHNDGISKS